MNTKRTPKQFLSSETRRYKTKYAKLFGLDRYSMKYGQPARCIPGCDHSIEIGPFLYSRPYPIGHQGFFQLADFVREYDLKIMVASLSGWSPQTLVVEIVKREWEDDFWNEIETWQQRSEIKEIIYRRVYSEAYHVVRQRNGIITESKDVWVLSMNEAPNVFDVVEVKKPFGTIPMFNLGA